MPLYQLTLFYPNLKEHSATVRHIRGDVEAIAGKNWRVLSAGEQVCAIAFETDAEHGLICSRLRSYGSERFLFLLTEIAAVLDSYMPTGAWQWLSPRRAAKKAP